MMTQWRTGMNGPTGLDYTALPVIFKIRGVKKKDRVDVYEGMRIMEQAALKSIRESR
jgi:hypothetical protein